MVKRMLTLTLMAAMLFPVCANAQAVQPANLSVMPPDDDYQTSPTLGWTCASGPTIFKITVKDGNDVTIVNEDTVDAGTITDGKWDRTGIDVLEGEAETYIYRYESLSLTNPDTYSWQIVAEREDAKTGKTDGYIADPAPGDAITLLGDITLSLAADKTDAEIDDIVTVTVSMDNLTNGAVPTNSMEFSIGYNADVLTAPSDATPLGSASAITPSVNTSGSGDAAKATVSLSGKIAAGAGDIVSLEFTVANAGSNTFALVQNDTLITSEDVNPPTGQDRNPAVVEGDPQVLTVAEPVTKGDLDGDKDVDLTDAVIALKVLAGLDIAAYEAAVGNHSNKQGKVDAALVVFILNQL